MRLALIAAALLATPLSAEDAVQIVPPPAGSVSIEAGLEAWSRIYEVASHPRCSNCHVGADNRPMWSGPSYGKARPHGMNINAGESRIGVETLQCMTCHSLSTRGNQRPHEAPRVGTTWMLAPVEAEWFGKTTEEICAQLRDPDRNGDRSFEDIAEHLTHDLILHWAWTPGPGREPAPYDLQSHVNDILAWGVAGMPCPQD